jgi:multisubunit Na+/H+ antiporter MnhG subunit
LVSNILGIVVGVIGIVLGFILLIVWWSTFISVLKGVIPLLLILIGAGVFAYFISEMKSKLASEKEKPPAAPPPEEKKPE